MSTKNNRLVLRLATRFRADGMRRKKAVSEHDRALADDDALLVDDKVLVAGVRQDDQPLAHHYLH